MEKKRKNNLATGYVSYGLTFDNFRREIISQPCMSDNTRTVFSIVLNNEGHKTVNVKCNSDTVTNDSNISVLSKPCTDEEIASEFSPERALFYMHGWSFPSIDGTKIDLFSLSFGKNTPIFQKSCSSKIVIKSSKFVTIMKKIFKPYIRNESDLKLFAGHAWRICRTHDSMKMQHPKDL